MILIADSGASKSDWRLINRDGSIEQFQTLGFNPYYQSIDQLEKEVSEGLLPKLNGGVQEVYFYGAGCSSEENKGVIYGVLSKHFDSARIEILDDMLAAARALCGKEPGIACILGTGANSCYYDGVRPVEQVTSLGYLLGDEGSGAYIGKVLLGDYLRKDLPQVIHDRFEKRFNLGRDQILERVYHQELPGRFMASFAKFVFQNIQDPYCYGLVYNGFSLFFEKNVLKYSRVNEVPVHFSGSVAFYFGNILRQVANDKEVVLRNIIESPIAGLALFHKSQLETL